MRVIVKIGSNILADAAEGLNQNRIDSFADWVVSLRENSHEVVIVSSGAVAAGRKRLGLKSKPKKIQLKQAAAAVGQSALMWAYEKAFSRHKITVAQMLLTRETMADRRTYINARNTLIALLDLKVVPVINENDTVANEEIRFGDNDKLAALVAQMADAKMLVILSDVDGLYDANPVTNPNAKLIPIIPNITSDYFAMAGGSSSDVGTGGMYSKIRAAEIATNSGIASCIINGKELNHLKRFSSQILTSYAGNNVDNLWTICLPKRSRASSRKGWIAHGSQVKGTLVLDDGAVRAVVERQKSLLPSGIVRVEGEFEPGDAVRCVDSAGRKIARGLTNYSSSDLDRIKGAKTSEIERILGYRYSDEAVHRDNMVVVSE